MKRILRFIIGIVIVGAVAYLFTSGTRIIDENNNMQRSAKVALEDYIDTGKALPVGEYVSLEARWVIGPFATETSTSTTNGIKATSGVDYYYFLVLEDGTVMALESNNKKDRQILDRMSNWLVSVDGYPMNGETIKLNGKLKELKGNDLLNLYRSNIISTFGISSSDPSVRYLVLDTTAGRETVYLIIVGVVAVGIIAAVVSGKRKKKKAQQAAAQTST